MYLRDQTHLGHHKHLEHHISTHLGHHKPHFCERVVTGGQSLRSLTQTYYIPLDMGTWSYGTWGGHGDMDMGFRGCGSITSPIHKTNTFRVRHGNMATWGLGDMGTQGHGV